MQNLQTELAELLQNEENLVIDGQLNKNKVVELALQVNPKLMALLLKNETFKKHFFTDVEGVLVFDKIEFQRFVNNKSFLPDSYTAFKNKIGLILKDESTGNYIKTRDDVVLAWPHKDCVLEGGQTKEDQRRNEIFWNETLAPDEVDRLLDPKVFTNWKLFDKNGEHEVKEFTGKENLIIKGNNLLALTSIKECFKGQIKLIYIDPPYNTGSDSFQYNDKFNHATWLTFMKNRLEFAKKLLANEGAIYIQINHLECAYLKILCDEIFGRENFVQMITLKTSTPSGFKVVNPGAVNVTEYILFYTKDKQLYKFKPSYVESNYQTDYNRYIKNPDDNPTQWQIGNVKEKVIENLGFTSIKDVEKKYGKDVASLVIKAKISEFASENSEIVFATYGPHNPAGVLKDLLANSLLTKGKIFYHNRENQSPFIVMDGRLFAFYSKKLKNIDGKNVPTQLLTDLWIDLSWDSLSLEGGVSLKNGKKPERLLQRIIDISTDPGDLVLDFHLGSGTTAAVAHKMQRQYIGIEQLNYEENDSVKRLRNVINGDLSGISKSTNWQGGGSFIYCELKKDNQLYIDRIQEASTKDDLLAIWNDMESKATLSYQFDKATFNERIAAFKTAPIDEMKQYLVEVLDKNQLYVNYSEINDTKHHVSDHDKQLNKQFYTVKR